MTTSPTQQVSTAMVSPSTETASNYPVVSTSKFMSPTAVNTATTGPSTPSPVTTESASSGTELQVRLAGGPTPLAGRVEVRDGTGPWGSVCDDRWDLQDAHVVCRQLGFGTALGVKLAGHFGESSGSVWLDEVACGGNETNLGDCPAEPWGQNDCSHKEDAGVVCEGGGSLRLVGGLAPWEGRLEVRPWQAAEWGTVCSAGWTEAETEFACRRLGYTGGANASLAAFGEGTGRIWLGDVTCGGDEASLTSCGFTWEPSDCDHRQDVALVCTGGLSVRLTGSRSPLQGRVEVRPGYLDWGTVCDGFDDLDAQVVCRQLGHRAGVATVGGDFGEGTGDIWLKSVDCIGVESSIGDCQVLSGSSDDCSHSQDAGVICTGDVSARLIGGQTLSEGRLEVRPGNGDWGTVCDDGFDDRDAQVVCRQLGYRGGVATVGGVYPEGTGDIWLEDLYCDGNESSVADCGITKWGDHDCSHKEDAGVICTASNCVNLYAAGQTTSGVYNIRINSSDVDAYCDMDTAGGGWTVIQRRVDGSVPFNRNWEEYKHGFGNKSGEYWLGNENIHLLTNQTAYTLRVDMQSWDGQTRYAEYSSFRVSGESDQYRLHISGYSGTAGDDMSLNNGQMFSTVDRDNANWDRHCSQEYGQAGWWFGGCSYAFLNGRYLGDCGYYRCSYKQGVVWDHWRGGHYSLKSVSMKIRP
ncbi:PREDICTED: scavenger receptor cysteine-rich type 1 protein M130-like [Branchiostoma belcheri]|uniref:Soluble scavenger receptor cysteine-rich domain-containing protein SSC5D n=1 Tax=Branchiostoma belcheri TaxID=7741 RepID=A0A6P4YJP7_BRABE|nr:PREDICTED: scavenger receptor cysteine-rich type 1 protein M130-like [Branchiostoma belcheri]